MMRCYQGGQIASESSSKLISGEVLVGKDGKIDAIGKVELADDTEVVNCEGKILVPGMFDMQVHACDPGLTHREDLASCGTAALRGGVTGMALMPDTIPVIDTPNLIRSVMERAADICPVPIVQMGAITKGVEGKELAAIGGMAKAGAPMLSDSSQAVADPLVFKRAMEYAKEFGIPIANRGDTEILSQGGAMNEGSTSYRLGLPGFPRISEEIGLARDLKIAEYTRSHLHIQQVSTSGAVELIRRAKNDGINVTCEVSPQHLLLTEDAIGEYNTTFKVLPPLRTEADNEALIAGLKDGTIDAIASGHSPLTKYEKRTDFGSAPFGVTGLETAVVVLFDELIRNQVIGWDVLTKAFSANPRRILGQDVPSIEKGQLANFFVFDPQASSRFTVENMASKSCNSPFLEREYRGAIDQIELRFES